MLGNIGRNLGRKRVHRRISFDKVYFSKTFFKSLITYFESHPEEIDEAGNTVISNFRREIWRLMSYYHDPAEELCAQRQAEAVPVEPSGSVLDQLAKRPHSDVEDDTTPDSSPGSWTFSSSSDSDSDSESANENLALETNIFIKTLEEKYLKITSQLSRMGQIGFSRNILHAARTNLSTGAYATEEWTDKRYGLRAPKRPRRV